MRIGVISLILISLISTSSCKKGNKAIPNGLSGTWELRHLEGAQIPNFPSDFAPGNGYQWKFADSTYESIRAGSVVQRGFFSVLRGIGRPQLIIDRDTTNNISFDLNGNQLILYRGIIAADGDVETYARL